MKNLLATVAIGALMGSAAVAQDASTEGAMTYDVQQGDFYASNLLGSRLYTTEQELTADTQFADVYENWNDIGEINDFVVSEGGSVQAVIVGVGGFLGIGEKDVAISMDDLTTTFDDDGSRFLVVNMSQEALENAPAFEYEELDNDIGEASEVDGADAGADAAVEEAATDTAATDEEMATEGAVETEMVEGEEAMTEETAETDMAATDTEATAEETDTEMAEGDEAMTEETAETEMAATETEATAEEGAEAEMAEGDEAMTEEAADAETAAADAEAATAEEGAATETAEGDEAMTEETMDPTETAAADAAVAADSAELAAPEGFQLVPVTDLTAEELDGATVRSSTDEEWVGEISSLILDDQGQVVQAVIDVGGFLGIGEKPVAMNFDDLEIYREDASGALEVRVNASREELEGMSAFEG
ncbi:PRC-barrel domain-containing protein [Wenxinia marina]|uniref:PRC-barrel domain protein n=1 Tax=Wenxinia marina DSM 24838 TaxID=1123501 RepID=A0A0D0QHE8_9RHOB|nr:PRC-barrel domain-containing protein [Wenxinia marina]KIQ70493.1 PRC-barrel domain protein [Wenxinia marina DSM 24838]GGL52665.1 hypothetical protein GCM10011392_03820 [Wenxinia marina]